LFFIAQILKRIIRESEVKFNNLRGEIFIFFNTFYLYH